MEYLNKLKNTVTGVMPGNPITREFEVHGHRASAGPGLLWRIYDATKKTTKQEASVFMFEKKTIDRYSKRDKDIIIDVLKKGVSQLTRLRHPKILSVLHPLEESRESLAFATEPVFASLANVLGSHDNMPSSIPHDLQDYNLYDVEIKYGLLQMSEGLTFLHSSVKLVHCNMCPQAIIINKSGAWKLAGFDFVIHNANQAEQASGTAQAYYPFREWDPEIPHLVQPHLDYLAPEFTLSMTCDTASDMFSLGVLFYAVFNNGRTIYECQNQLGTFKKNVEELRSLKMSILGGLPEEVRDHVKLLLNAEPTVRPDADQLSKIPFFEDVGAMTLQYLDSLMQRDNLQKSQFFKGLPKVLAKLPKRVGLHRVLPSLCKECINHDMVPFVLPNLLLIAEQASEQEYIRYILPELIPLFKIKEPIQVMLVFLQNMSLLLSKTPQADIRNHVLPMLYRAMEADTPQLQELVLNILPTFASLVEYSSMKNHIVPRIKKLCLTTTNLSIRVQSLMCLGKLLEYMDKWYVQDEVFPILMNVPSREPAVLMSILGIFKVTMTHPKLGISKDVMANKVLPFIVPLAIDSNLNLCQFNAYIATVKDMVSKVESEHRSKLEQLNSIKQEQRSLQFTHESAKDTLNLVPGMEGKQETMMDKFLSGFGISSFLSGGSSSAPADPSPSASSNQSSSTLTNGSVSSMDTVPKMTTETKLPNQPAKGLSLEEKQRLAREQEQQQRYKSQQAIQPKSNTTAPKPVSMATKPTSQPMAANKPKDLTSTLMSSNMNNLALSGNKPATYSTGSGSAFGTSSSSTTSAFGSSSGYSSSGSNVMSPTSSMGGMSTFPGSTMAGSTRGMGGSGMGGSTMGMGGSSMGMGGSSMGMGGSSMGMGGSSMGMGGSGMGMGGSGMGMGGSSMGMGGSSMGMGGSGMSGFASTGQSSKPQQPAQNKSVDMSAFDSLLPSKPKMSMGQLQAQRQTGYGVMPQSNMAGNMGGNMAGNMGMMGGQQSGRPMMQQPMQPAAQPNKPKNLNDFDDLFG